MDAGDQSLKNRAVTPWIEVSGKIEIGIIEESEAKEIGLPAGPIKLGDGIPGPKGYGLAHIQPDRVADLKKIGFDSAQDSIVEVAANWEVAIKANQPNRVVLVRKHRGRYLNLVVQAFAAVDRSGHYWSVVTIVIKRRFHESDVLFRRV